MPNATLNGIDIFYEHGGMGPRLLFCNGSGSTLREARGMIDPLREHFEVIAHDQRGLGRSAKPEGPYTMAQYAADAAALAAYVGWERYRVIGISFGGMVAQELAVTWPERVERLVLAVTSPGGAGGSSYPLHTLADMDEARRQALAPTLLDTRYTPEFLAEHPADRAIAQMMAQRSQIAKSPDVLRGERLQLDARAHFDVFDRLTRIACPTLVQSGRYDGIAPPANGRAIAGQIPGAEYREYEIGHAIPAIPAATADAIAFLAAR
jgi:pimeloyl-ACP methyl ester carboxylesterase